VRIRDAQAADLAAIHRLIGQLAEVPDEAAFRARFERVFNDTAGREGFLVPPGQDLFAPLPRCFPGLDRAK